MPNMKPIPINCGIIATKNTVSLDGKYTACINKTWIIPKITIIDNNKVYFAGRKPTHFQHIFFDTTKIYALQFNSSSDKLYCLAKKKQQSQLYQFNLVEAENQSKNTWQQQPTIPIALRAKYFSIDETNQDLITIFLKSNELFCDTISIKDNIITHNHITPPQEKIIDIKYDATNRVIYAYLKNKALIIFSKINNVWEQQHILNNCPSLPHCYSGDGKTLVFINNSKVQIRCLSSAHPDKIVKEINYDNIYKTDYKRTTIKNVCINTQGNDITALVLRSKGNDLNPYFLFSSHIKKHDLTWKNTENNPFQVFAQNSRAILLSYGEFSSYYVDSTNTTVLVNFWNIYFSCKLSQAELRIENDFVE